MRKVKVLKVSKNFPSERFGATKIIGGKVRILYTLRGECVTPKSTLHYHTIPYHTESSTSRE